MSELTNPSGAPAPGSGVKFEIPPDVDPVLVLGHHDATLDVLREQFPEVTIHPRGALLTVTGNPQEVDVVLAFLGEVVDLVRSGVQPDADLIRRSISLLRKPERVRPSQLRADAILTVRGRDIRPRTAGQHSYVSAIGANTLTFGIGPAGTGKTFLAMAMAVQALQNKTVSRIILTRPAVEAGERLGYLPGSLSEKIDPYLRPLFDALRQMVEPDQALKLVESNIVEVAPLAYMRGRTLDNAFIILDEAQNTSPEQMKMFLTRMGNGAKVVVTGDITQVDLPPGIPSGLKQITQVLNQVEDVSFCYLTAHDVVRHPLVSRIVEAYERWSQ